MHIKSIIIDGFKSYGKRTEINGFDPLFNAITGLNGSGKSNILDSICFVLGISNLGHVRAGSLQELVYKNGQAGVTKASVTIAFDNHNPDSCPIGYEQFEEITVTRQVIVGGKNKYLINGSNVQNKRVQDLFGSVQLNVNNPHFLIMQGRITKVLNMKPPEILSMIEEAAGTRMYESKRRVAEKTIEKKDAKLRELNDLIDNDIAPRIRKLKEEQGQYMEYQKLTRDVERVTRIYIAWQYVHSKESVDKAKTQVSQTTDKIEEIKNTIISGEEELKDLKVTIEEIQKRKDEESGSKLKEFEIQLQEVEKEEAKCTSKLKATKDSVKSQMKSKLQLEKSLEDDDNTLTKKQTEMSKLEGLFQDLKEADQKDSEALTVAQEKFQAISSGLLAGPAGGEAATLQDQLMACEQEIVQAATEAKQSDMQLKHCKSQLVEKKQELKQTEKEYQKDKQILDTVERELEGLEAQLTKLDYQDGTLENLTDAKQKLTSDIRAIKERIDSYERRFPHVFFQYRDPEQNFDRSRVKGLVCMHIKVKDPAKASALQVVAGGQLYNVIVDTELTSKLLLQHGQLQHRTTFIPLNKIASRGLDTRVIQVAQQLVGKDNVWPALSLIDYDPSLKRAMEFIFGRVFVARNMEIAKVIAFDERIRHKCVTLEGDVFDPAGVLSGGARSKSTSILLQLQDLKEAQLQLKTMETNLRNLDIQIHKVKSIAEKFNRAKQDMELKKHQVLIVQQNLQQTTHHKTKEEVEALENKMSEFEVKVANCKRIQSEGANKVKELENMVKNAKEIRERELKLAEKEMLNLKKKAEDSRAQWLKREQECEGLKLEIQELKVSISQSRKQITDVEEEVAKLSEEKKSIEGELKNIKDLVDNKLDIVKKHKEVINAHTKEIQKAIGRQEEIEKAAGDLGLLIKKQEHELSKQKNDVKECQSKVAALMKNYNWIADEEQFFGHPKGAYDFNSVDVRQLGKNINHMEERKEELGRKLNLRALNMLGKEEEQYKDLLEKKRVVENDKGKIMQVMRQLDEKKKKALRRAWSQVDKDFGSIFSTLLPGANACLKPPDGMDVLDGLEVKVGFGGLWKDSLNELSGGQRSLVALSLILSMLLFKPAPIYILDEVDAALDLSHTQNIGTMLRTHFKQSQFIVVSLKDGMFNNANVLFRTEFIDGMSTVTRNVQNPHQAQQSSQPYKKKKAEFEVKVANCKRIQSEGANKVKELENMVKNAKEIRERELKLAEKEMLNLKKKAEDSRAQWLKREQECEGLKLEIQELKVSISQSRKQITDVEEEVAKLSEEKKSIEGELKNIKDLVDNKLDIVKKHKEVINAHTKEIQKAIGRQEEIEKAAGDLGLLIKKQEHELSKQKNDVKECQSKVAALMKNYNWIADEEQFFGHPKGAYDFNSVDVRQLGKNINHMEERKEELGRKLNLRALNMLGKEEEQYKDLLEKKRVVENDKGKIMQVMRQLDEKKKKALRRAWSQVDKDFGSIFSTLLPGANACLKPPDGMDVLDGLEVKVGFGGLWKDSLNELSGGQRSLVALSLILSMLLFKPAPIYILDEVDAALDLSHTQNIGTMLRTHFKQSQFIVVSLKDGMFNNANVLFRTEFIDGMSTVTRNVQNPHQAQQSSQPYKKKKGSN